MKGSVTLALVVCLALCCGCHSPLVIGGDYYPVNGGPLATAGVLGSVAITAISTSAQIIVVVAFFGLLILVFASSPRTK